MADRLVARFSLDTYVREVERYGGDEGVILAEEFFGADSEAVVAILAALRDDSDALAWRWKLALCGVDTMLSAFGMDGTAADWTAARCAAYAHEFAPSKVVLRQISDRFRRERDSLVQTLQLARSLEAEEYPALAALRRRNERFAALGAALGRLDRAGRLTAPFAEVAASLAHLHVNRMLRLQQRFQEYVIFDFLRRLRHSVLARG
jgi:thiopeptide-type bacteriocin biosynthesis protein